MTTAILCPGPSLKNYAASDFCGRVVGVNRAALGFACDWWVCLDLPLLCETAAHVKGCPNLFTARDSYAALSRESSLWAGRFPLLAEDLFVFLHPSESKICWTHYTATAALILAAHLGATSIKVYGADWTDAPDFDGIRVEGANRTAERWAREQEIWGKVTGWLVTRGIVVDRVNGN